MPVTTTSKLASSPSLFRGGLGQWCPVGPVVFLAGGALLREQNRTHSLRCGGSMPRLVLQQCCAEARPAAVLVPTPIPLGLQCWPGDAQTWTRDISHFPMIELHSWSQARASLLTSRTPTCPIGSLLVHTHWHSCLCSESTVGTGLGPCGQSLPTQAFPGPALHQLSGWSMPWSEGRQVLPSLPSRTFWKVC